MNKIIHYSFIIRHEYRLYEYEYEYRIPYEYEYEYELVFMNYSLFIVQGRLQPTHVTQPVTTEVRPPHGQRRASFNNLHS